MDAFSSNEDAVINRTVAVDIKKALPLNIDEYFEIDRCLKFIISNKFGRVALQFPDELLRYSGSVVSALQRSTSSRIFVLGDTAYGSCCVDEVTAEHAEADAIIHFGRACLSPTSRTPVLYIFGKQPLDVQHCVSSIKEEIQDPSKHLLLLYDVFYSHIADELSKELSTFYVRLVSSQLNIPNRECRMPTRDEANEVSKENGSSNKSQAASSSSISKFGRWFRLDDNISIEEYTILFIGSESLTLTNFMMNFNQCQFYTYNPETRMFRKEDVNINRKLMKRYYLVEKAKDASVIGILVGTLGVSKYLDIINQLKVMIKKAGKKYYTFVVGKLNVAKLANLMEIEVYVMVACPENSLVDSQEFYQPIVTPFEMELACNQAREWTGKYESDFRDLLPGASMHVPYQEPTSDDPDISLITGQMRSLPSSLSEEIGQDNSKAVVKRDDVLTVSINHRDAGEYLANRSWRGLETNMGQTEVTSAVEGTTGIAASYSHENEEGTPV